MTTTTKREFEKLGYSMWRTEASPKSGEKWYYITAHLCPYWSDDFASANEQRIHLICSCKDFTIGIASREGNALVTPCKHIRDFDESEVDIEILERSYQG